MPTLSKPLFDDHPLQTKTVRLPQGLPMGAERLLRTLMRISREQDCIRFRIGGVLYRFKPLNYAQPGFDDVQRVADQLHAPEEMVRFVVASQERVRDLLKEVELRGAWAEEGEADEDADEFHIRMEDVQLLFGPLLTAEYLINVERFHDEHVEGRVVELLHVILNGRGLPRANGGCFDVFRACSDKYGKDVGVDYWEFFRLLEFAVDPPDELKTFARDMRVRSEAVLTQLHEGLDGSQGGIKGVQGVFQDLLEEQNGRQWNPANIDRLKGELRTGAGAAEARYRAELDRKKREREEEEEAAAGKRQRGDDSEDDEEGSEYEDDGASEDASEEEYEDDGASEDASEEEDDE